MGTVAGLPQNFKPLSTADLERWIPYFEAYRKRLDWQRGTTGDKSADECAAGLGVPVGDFLERHRAWKPAQAAPSPASAPASAPSAKSPSPVDAYVPGSLRAFFERCRFFGPLDRAPAAAITRAYERYCSAEGLRPESQTAMGRVLARMGCQKRTVRGRRVWLGIGLNGAARPARPDDELPVRRCQRWRCGEELFGRQQKFCSRACRQAQYRRRVRLSDRRRDAA